MSISSELLTLQNTKTAIRTAINNKGGSVGASDTFASYATAIDNLPTGGSNADLIDLIEGDITTMTIPSGTTSIRTGAFYQLTSLTSITIPNSVTTIGQEAFHSCSHLTSANIPNTLTSIPAQMFYGCTVLSNIVLPETITSIDRQAFYNCNNFSTFTIPSAVTSIGNSVFQGCNHLTYVVCKPTTPPTLGTNVFYTNYNYPIYVPAESVDAYKAATNWSTLASRIYPIQQVATVDGNPVYNYEIGVTDSSTLTDLQVAALPSGDVLEFAEGVTYMQGQIGGYEEVILPSTFTGFGDTEPINAATTTLTSKATTPPSVDRNNLGGSGLTAIYVPSASVDTYKAHAAWSGFASIIQAIPVPLMAEITQSDDSVYEIPYDGVGVLDENNVPFEDALAQATDIHITSYATAIGQPYELDGAYYGVFEGDGATNTLETVTIDEGLTAIPNQAFASNVGLTTVTLPSTITSIGDYAFGLSDGSGPLGVMSFTIHATTPPTLGTDSVGVRKPVRPPFVAGKIYVPASAVDTYKAAAGWSDWAQYIEAIPSE